MKQSPHPPPNPPPLLYCLGLLFDGPALVFPVKDLQPVLSVLAFARRRQPALCSPLSSRRDLLKDLLFFPLTYLLPLSAGDLS